MMESIALKHGDSLRCIRAILWQNMYKYCVYETLDFTNSLSLYSAINVVKDFAFWEYTSSQSPKSWEIKEVIDLCFSTQDAIKDRLSNGDYLRYKF